SRRGAGCRRGDRLIRMLFQTPFHDRIRLGEITLTVRRWKRPQARLGGIYRLHSGGAIEVTALERIEAAEVTADVARAAGSDSPSGLLEQVERASAGEGDLYLVRFRYVGDVADPRTALAADDNLSDDDVAGLVARLHQMDRGHPWTHQAIGLIAAHEGMRAAELAQRMGRDTARFKTDVRRLKALGLTDSLEVGYRLTPRGRALLGRLDAVNPG
ncbi:MAG: ASCH domain-containing protein, partial [Dehalococcoidia bacterium]